MIVFENDGSLDLMALKTMGVSVKDAGAIGYFGTGLKFAIAVLLRTEHKVTMFIDDNAYSFTTRPTLIRGKSFNLIYLNDEPLAFTDDLGKNWKPWMAFRELASNAKDEGGGFYCAAQSPNPEAGRTIFVIEGNGIEEAFNKRDEIFFNMQGATRHARIDTKNVPTTKIYYKGVIVHELNAPALMTYNFKDGLTLTEDRTADSFYDIKRQASQFYLTKASQDEIYAMLKAPTESFEFDLDMDIYVPPSDDFLAVCKKMIDNKENIKQSAYAVFKKTTGYIEVDELMILNPVQSKQLQRAMAVLARIEPGIANANIVCQEKIKGGLLGMADLKSQKIYLSKRVFDQGTKQVAATLLEEFYHNRYEYRDCTYDLQTFLFDVIIGLLEQLNGEPV